MGGKGIRQTRLTMLYTWERRQRVRAALSLSLSLSLKTLRCQQRVRDVRRHQCMREKEGDGGGERGRETHSERASVPECANAFGTKGALECAPGRGDSAVVTAVEGSRW